MNNKNVVYFFCPDREKDSAGANILDHFMKIAPLSEAGFSVDGFPVLLTRDHQDNAIYLVRTKVVICVEYEDYLPMLKEHFQGFDLAVMVNWHGGANAPDRVLCIHTVGDVTSGIFGPSEVLLTSNIARSMEAHRLALGLEDFRVTTEATHWSGIVYQQSPQLLEEFSIPFIDVEIGSTPESYENPLAAEVIAKALLEVFAQDVAPPIILYCGGIHFEDTITAAVLHPTAPLALTHILPSRWIENESYTGEEGKKRILDCIKSIHGKVEAIVVHEKLKKEQRDLLAEIASQLEIPFIKRKALKDLPSVYELIFK